MASMVPALISNFKYVVKYNLLNIIYIFIKVFLIEM